MQYMNFMCADITKSNVDTEKFKMAAVFKIAVKMAAKILENSINSLIFNLFGYAVHEFYVC